MSSQDDYYLSREADAFFERNFGNQALTKELRPYKKGIFDFIQQTGIEPKKILEYGCNYGDLLNHYSTIFGANCFGVEASQKAVEAGNQLFGDTVHLSQGTIASNPVNSAPQSHGTFDLIIIDDVLCWVSRDTLFQSISNIDQALTENGILYLREFYPLNNSKNRNHHVQDAEVFCFKPAGPHVEIFIASGMYRILSQRVFIDNQDNWVNKQDASIFETRWMETALVKSSLDFYD